VVLGYSRLLWLQFYPQQSMAILMRGLEAAFAYFGGVPTELLFDQLKAVVLHDHRPLGGRVLENPEFLRFAAHWDFRIRACRPYRAQTKGTVERPIRYVRQNFLYGRDFAGDADLNAQSLDWLGCTANVRVHGTTHEMPQVRFDRDERAVLHPLAARPYRSLVLPLDAPRVTATPRRLTPVEVERRPLAAYAALAGAFA
jgi:transposase